MLKLQFDIQDFNEQEIVDAFQSQLNAATAATAEAVYARGKDLAADRLRSGLKHWNNGYKFHKIEDGNYIITIEGKLAYLMEKDQIAAGEISDMILKGNRAKYNKENGKRYVDVPMSKDADAAGNIQTKGGTYNVKQFKSADDLMKQFSQRPYKFSDVKRGGVKTENRIVQRVKEVIKSVNPADSSAQFLNIVRLSEESKWPATPREGARVLDDLELEVSEIFDTMLSRYF
jgi:hypothetical protein